jgi:hypothetical protein
MRFAQLHGKNSMPDYLVFDVTGGKGLENSSPRLVENAANKRSGGPASYRHLRLRTEVR